MLDAFVVVKAMRQVFSVLFRRGACGAYVARQQAVAVRGVKVVRVYLGLASVSMVFVSSSFVQDKHQTFMSPHPFAGRANYVSIVFRCFKRGSVFQVVKVLSSG